MSLPASWAPSPGTHELAIATDLWHRASQGRPVLPAANGAAFFSQSGLSREVLRVIWGLADPADTGHLDFRGFCVACRLISMAQHGAEVSDVAFRAMARMPLPPPSLGPMVSPAPAVQMPMQMAHYGMPPGYPMMQQGMVYGMSMPMSSPGFPAGGNSMMAPQLQHPSGAPTSSAYAAAPGPPFSPGHSAYGLAPAVGSPMQPQQQQYQYPQHPMYQLSQPITAMPAYGHPQQPAYGAYGSPQQPQPQQNLQAAVPHPAPQPNLAAAAPQLHQQQQHQHAPSASTKVASGGFVPPTGAGAAASGHGHPKEANDDDDFGDFGGAAAAAVPAQQAVHTVAAQQQHKAALLQPHAPPVRHDNQPDSAADFDDDFGDFDAAAGADSAAVAIPMAAVVPSASASIAAAAAQHAPSVASAASSNRVATPASGLDAMLAAVGASSDPLSFDLGLGTGSSATSSTAGIGQQQAASLPLSALPSTGAPSQDRPASAPLLAQPQQQHHHHPLGKLGAKTVAKDPFASLVGDGDDDGGDGNGGAGAVSAGADDDDFGDFGGASAGAAAAAPGAAVGLTMPAPSPAPSQQQQVLLVDDDFLSAVRAAPAPPTSASASTAPQQALLSGPAASSSPAAPISLKKGGFAAAYSASGSGSGATSAAAGGASSGTTSSGGGGVLAGLTLQQQPHDNDHDNSAAAAADALGGDNTKRRPSIGSIHVPFGIGHQASPLKNAASGSSQHPKAVSSATKRIVSGRPLDPSPVPAPPLLTSQHLPASSPASSASSGSAAAVNVPRVSLSDFVGKSDSSGSDSGGSSSIATTKGTKPAAAAPATTQPPAPASSSSSSSQGSLKSVTFPPLSLTADDVFTSLPPVRKQEGEEGVLMAISMISSGVDTISKVVKAVRTALELDVLQPSSAAGGAGGKKQNASSSSSTLDPTAASRLSEATLEQAQQRLECAEELLTRALRAIDALPRLHATNALRRDEYATVQGLITKIEVALAIVLSAIEDNTDRKRKEQKEKTAAEAEQKEKLQRQAQQQPQKMDTSSGAERQAREQRAKAADARAGASAARGTSAAAVNNSNSGGSAASGGGGGGGLLLSRPRGSPGAPATAGAAVKGVGGRTAQQHQQPQTDDVDPFASMPASSSSNAGAGGLASFDFQPFPSSLFPSASLPAAAAPAAVVAAEDDDGFGDFGSVQPAIPAPGHVVTAAPPQTSAATTIDDAFDSLVIGDARAADAPLPPLASASLVVPAAAAPAAVASSAVVAPIAVAQGVPSHGARTNSNVANHAAIADDDFGDFDAPISASPLPVSAPVTSPPAVMAQFTTTAAPSSSDHSVKPTVTAAVAEEDDDGFGDFGAVQAAPAPVAIAPGPVMGIDSVVPSSIAEAPARALQAPSLSSSLLSPPSKSLLSPPPAPASASAASPSMISATRFASPPHQPSAAYATTGAFGLASSPSPSSAVMTAPPPSFASPSSPSHAMPPPAPAYDDDGGDAFGDFGPPAPPPVPAALQSPIASGPASTTASHASPAAAASSSFSSPLASSSLSASLTSPSSALRLAPPPIPVHLLTPAPVSQSLPLTQHYQGQQQQGHAEAAAPATMMPSSGNGGGEDDGWGDFDGPVHIAAAAPAPPPGIPAPAVAGRPVAAAATAVALSSSTSAAAAAAPSISDLFDDAALCDLIGGGGVDGVRPSFQEAQLPQLMQPPAAAAAPAVAAVAPAHNEDDDDFGDFDGADAATAAAAVAAAAQAGHSAKLLSSPIPLAQPATFGSSNQPGQQTNHNNSDDDDGFGDFGPVVTAPQVAVMPATAANQPQQFQHEPQQVSAAAPASIRELTLAKLSQLPPSVSTPILQQCDTITALRAVRFEACARAVKRANADKAAAIDEDRLEDAVRFKRVAAEAQARGSGSGYTSSGSTVPKGSVMSEAQAVQALGVSTVQAVIAAAARSALENSNSGGAINTSQLPSSLPELAATSLEAGAAAQITLARIAWLRGVGSTGTGSADHTAAMRPGITTAIDAIVEVRSLLSGLMADAGVGGGGDSGSGTVSNTLGDAVRSSLARSQRTADTITSIARMVDACASAGHTVIEACIGVYAAGAASAAERRWLDVAQLLIRLQSASAALVKQLQSILSPPAPSSGIGGGTGRGSSVAPSPLSEAASRLFESGRGLRGVSKDLQLLLHGSGGGDVTHQGAFVRAVMAERVRALTAWSSPAAPTDEDGKAAEARTNALLGSPASGADRDAAQSRECAFCLQPLAPSGGGGGEPQSDGQRHRSCSNLLANCRSP